MEKEKLFRVISKRTGIKYWVYEVWRRNKNQTLYLIYNQGRFEFWDADDFRKIDNGTKIYVLVMD